MSIVSTLHRIRFAWFKTLGVLALILFAALLVGLLIGQVWIVLTLTALAEIAWQYWRLYQVLHQLAVRRRWTRSMDIGVWKELDHLICRNQTDMRARVHRLLEMLRTYRAAAAALLMQWLLSIATVSAFNGSMRRRIPCWACVILATWTGLLSSGCSRCR